MTPYHVIEASQRDVLRYFLVGPSHPAGQEVLLPDEIPEHAADGACLLLWKRDLPMIPHALVAQPEVLRKVLPKLMALPSFTAPVTGLFRAWTFDDIQSLNRRRAPSPEHTRLEAFVGLMIGELISRIGPQLDLKALASSSVRRTLAYVLASLQLAGADEQETALAIHNWEHAAELTQTQINPELILMLANLSSFAQAIPPAPRISHYQLAASIREWISVRGNADPNFERLIEQVISAISSLKDVSREERFDVLMALVQNVRRSGSNMDGSIQLVVGYLLSLIEPGSLDFLPLSYEMEDVLGAPGIACSYAMCAALMSGKEFLMRGAGLGVHIILSGLMQPRAPDISFHELQMLGNSATVSDLPLRTAAPSIMEVELIPEITAAFFIGQRKGEQGGNESRPRGVELDAHQVGELERITMGLEELGHMASRLRASVLNDEPQSSSKGKRLYRKK